MKPMIVIVGVMIVAFLGIFYFSNPWFSEKMTGNTVPVKFEVKISKGTFADPNMETITVTKVSSCGWGAPLSIAIGSVDAEVHIDISGNIIKTNSVLIGDSSSSTVTACADIPPGRYSMIFELNWKQGSGSWDDSERITKTYTIAKSGVT